jgi:hypothetical protein
MNKLDSSVNDNDSYDYQSHEEAPNEGYLDDDLLLTRTEGTLKNGFNSATNVVSTQRSNFMNNASQDPGSGEFEKRITDIKAKLN